MANKQSKIVLIQDNNRKNPIWNVYVNGKTPYTYFDNETKAKAAAFDEACKEIISGKKVTISYLSF